MQVQNLLPAKKTSVMLLVLGCHSQKIMVDKVSLLQDFSIF